MMEIGTDADRGVFVAILNVNIYASLKEQGLQTKGTCNGKKQTNVDKGREEVKHLKKLLTS